MKKNIRKTPYPNNIAFLLRRDNLKPVDLARITGWSETQVSRKVNGLVSVTPPQLIELEKKVGWKASEIYGAEPGDRKDYLLPITQYLGDDGEIFNLDKPLLEPEISSVGLPHNTKAVIVRANYLLPLIIQGSVILYNENHKGDIHSPRTDETRINYNTPGERKFSEVINRPCIVKLKDGRLLFRTLKEGSMPDRYHLIGHATADINNAEVIDAYKISSYKLDGVNYYR